MQEVSLGIHVMSSEQGAILRPQARLRSEAWARVRVRAVRVRRRGRNIFAVWFGGVTEGWDGLIDCL